MSPEELRLLVMPESLELIEQHSFDDPADFAMRCQGRRDIPVRAVAEQLACRRKAAKKLPELSRKPMLYTAQTLEQASGEPAAAYKASILSGDRLIDLSGGLGIDAMFLSRSFREVVYCERDPVLAELAAYNFRLFDIRNITIRSGDGPAILKEFPDNHFDWLFVDPCRRKGGRRSVGLAACSPDVLSVHDLLLRKALHIMVKASPALEPAGLRQQLPSLARIDVVSVGGECRETLLWLEQSTVPALPVHRHAVVLPKGGGDPVRVTGTGFEPRSEAVAVRKFVYEPDPAIIRAGLTAKLAEMFSFGYVNTSVDYLTADTLPGSFPGKAFRVVDQEGCSPKTLRTFLRRHAIVSASVQRRNFPLSPETIRKRFRLGESESRYLFFTKDCHGRSLCIYAVRADRAAPLGQARNEVPGY